MGHEFFLPGSVLPKTFIYPDSYLKYVSYDLPDLEPWHFFYSHLEFRFQGLKKRYPNRTLVPFARRSDNDDIACFDASITTDNPSVIIIHDFASSGWENHGICNDFLDWVRLAQEESTEWLEFQKNHHKELELLSKTISHALRHEPWLYELELDSEGWVSIEDILSALSRTNNYLVNMSEVDFVGIVARFEKQRHEIKNDKIRALYGHSTPMKLIKTQAKPPDILYHGTSPVLAEQILKEGLKPMSRHYVHLSIDTETARQVGYRKSNKPIILKVNTKKAYADGCQFYIGNEHVWLADHIPAEYISADQSISMRHYS